MSEATVKAEWVPLETLAAELSISTSQTRAWLNRNPRAKAMRRFLGTRTIRYPLARILAYVEKHAAETMGGAS